MLRLLVSIVTAKRRPKATIFVGSTNQCKACCLLAELEDGTKPFAPADAAKLQRKLPESVLNELELFLFGLSDTADMEETKND